MYTYISIRICMYVCMYVCMHVCMYLCTYVSIYLYVYVYVCIYRHRYVYINIVSPFMILTFASQGPPFDNLALLPNFCRSFEAPTTAKPLGAARKCRRLSVPAEAVACAGTAVPVVKTKEGSHPQNVKL